MGLGDVYKRQLLGSHLADATIAHDDEAIRHRQRFFLIVRDHHSGCLLYTSDAADERSSVDLGGRRIIKKKKKISEPIEMTDADKKHTVTEAEQRRIRAEKRKDKYKIV